MKPILELELELGSYGSCVSGLKESSYHTIIIYGMLWYAIFYEPSRQKNMIRIEWTFENYFDN